MFKKSRFVLICVICFLINVICVYAQEQITITTYYPSPFGSYNDLTVAGRQAIGDVNADGSVDANDMAVDGGGNPLPESLTVAGRVGIGTTQPGWSSRLHIDNTGFGNGLAVSEDDGAGRQTGVIIKGNYNATGRPVIGSSHSGAGVRPGLTFVTNDAERMTIDNLGNVGIGTASPNAKLDIAGSGGLWTTASWNKAIEIPNAAVLKWEANAGGYRHGIGQTTAGLYFGSALVDDNTGPITYNMFIGNNSRVGIGTASPAYTLDVAGDINTTGDVRKNGTAYINPDYVFEPGYALLPLGELKKFIAQKKHLPNMPSTQEIKKEGVKIFEQNRLMLEKLEEAYLYIIKLEERIAKLEVALVSKLNAE